MTLHTLFSWIPLTALALCFFVGCPSDDDVTDDDDDSAVGDDDVADDDAADDDAADDDAADDDAVDDDAADDDVAGDPDIVVNPPALNFGTVAVGTSAVEPLEIVNIGDGALEIFEMICPLKAITFNPFVGVIPPTGAETIPVTANCTVEEEVVGNLTIISNDPDESPMQIQVIVICDET